MRPIVVLLAALLALTGCGSASHPSTTGTQPIKKIQIDVEGSTISPNGTRVKVALGQQVQFIVTADAAGEIHVHSDPEKELPYNKGTTILEVGSFDKPGIIEVESHELNKTIVQLQVQ